MLILLRDMWKKILFEVRLDTEENDIYVSDVC